MAFVQLCTVDEVNYILREDAVLAHADDISEMQSHSESDANIAMAIDFASAFVMQHIGERYRPQDVTSESYEGSRWVKWSAATLAACSLVGRSGNPPTKTLSDDCERVRGDLIKIQARYKTIAGLPERSYEVPTTNNYRVIPGLYWSTRVKENQSTGKRSALSRPADWRDLHFATSFYGWY